MTDSQKHTQTLRREASRRLRQSTARLRRLNDISQAGQTVLPLWNRGDDR